MKKSPTSNEEKTMNYNTILYQKKNSIAKIILNRPGALNALNKIMITEIGDALGDAEKDNNVRVVVITGNGKAFCVGADLKFVKEELGSLYNQEKFFRFGNKTVMNAIEGLGKPVIAAVNGFAFAGGLELLLVCDLVIAAENALLADQHINYGLVGPGGSTQRLPRLVGIRKAKEIILTGERLSASEAERIGLVNRVVPAEELERATDDLATKIAEKSPVAVRIAKTLINRALETDPVTGSELEVMSAIVNGTSEDYKEGITAFNEKRKPVFKGR
jgi:enoyl-CoA hydratase/carnithine racemase